MDEPSDISNGISEVVEKLMYFYFWGGQRRWLKAGKSETKHSIDWRKGQEREKERGRKKGGKSLPSTKQLAVSLAVSYNSSRVFCMRGPAS